MIDVGHQSESVKKPKEAAMLALDLEGTLISNAISCFPRPGLYDFLEWANQTFSKVVIFSFVPEYRSRQLVEMLSEERSAPYWFAEVDVHKPTGSTKNFRA